MIQQYQVDRFPELSKSVVSHGKKDKSKSSDKEYQIKFRTGRESEKEKITALLNSSSDNHEDVVKWSEQVGLIISKLDEKSLRWLELSEGL